MNTHREMFFARGFLSFEWEDFGRHFSFFPKSSANNFPDEMIFTMETFVSISAIQSTRIEKRILFVAFHRVKKKSNRFEFTFVRIDVTTV